MWAQKQVWETSVIMWRLKIYEGIIPWRKDLKEEGQGLGLDREGGEGRLIVKKKT